MSWDINHVVLVGRLTRDPELTYTQSGAAVCRFSIAVNRTSGSKGENQEESTSFFNIVAWNKTAEICNEYLSKGKQVGVDGRLQQRRWSGSDGMKRSNVEIVANNVQFFGSARPQSGQFQESHPSSQEEKVSSQNSEDLKEEPARDPFLSELDDDEIPF